jgi:hyperosmotically inducible periplasmic protein
MEPGILFGFAIANAQPFSTTLYRESGMAYILNPIASARDENIASTDPRLIFASASGGNAMSTFTKTMGAATVGGLLVYFLDPDTGKRRRALVKDRSVSFVKDADRAIGKASRDMSNRARGAVAEARSRLPLHSVSDEVLVEQVRARLGRVNSFPHLVEVSARDGVIRLHGAALESEHDNFISQSLPFGTSLPFAMS